VVRALAQLDYALVQQCMHCGMCLPACPTYDRTKQERNSPRGRIALMRAVADGELEINHAFAEEMSYCLGCLACQTACPAGVNYSVLLETARAEVHHKRLATRTEIVWRAIALGLLFMRPRLLRVVGRTLRAYQRSGLDILMRRIGATRLLPRSLRNLEPRTPRIAPVFSNQIIAERERPRAGKPRHRVGLLTGCVQDLAFSEVNRDSVDVLIANSCEVHTPPVQPCCGSLHAHNGEPDRARTLARRLLDKLPPERYDAIISNAGGCGSHLRHYGRLLADDSRYADRARLWDSKIRDIHEWLLEIGYRAPSVGPFDCPVILTYQDSCHLAHGQRVYQQPRTVLKALPSVTLVDLPEADWCCGSAGIYSITQPEQSSLLLERKISRILATEATVVAAANPGCHLQIANGLAQLDAPVQVRHPVSLLAEAYRREEVMNQSSQGSL
jgi:glycolate oxidase iron-sulfur subunit